MIELSVDDAQQHIMFTVMFGCKKERDNIPVPSVIAPEWETILDWKLMYWPC